MDALHIGAPIMVTGELFLGAGLNRNRWASSVARVLLGIVAVLLGIGDAEGQTVMKAKEEYLKKLRDNGWPTFSSSTQYFCYPSATNAPVPFPKATKRTFGTKKDCTRVGDGDCVTFVKNISNLPDHATSNWRVGTKLVQGGKVVSNIAAGTVIATFDGSPLRYATSKRHTAVYARRIDDNTIEVYDQNWLVDPNDFSIRLGLVGRHKRLRIGGPDEANLNRFYVVVKP